MAEDTNSLRHKAVNRYILGKQHLSEDSKTDNIIQITQDIGGLHATSPTTPYLSLLARTNSFSIEMFREELYKKKSLAKVTFVRKTMFVLPKNMLPIAFSAVQRNTKLLTDQHLKYLQLTQKKYENISKEILYILKNRGQTLKELKTEMGKIPNLMYIVRMMCFQGLLIRGAPKSGWKSNLHTYFPFKEYFPDLELTTLDEKEAQLFVINHYIANFGPVTESDITWWTGFPKSLVRKLLQEIQDKLSIIQIKGFKSHYFVLTSQESSIKNIQIQNSQSINIVPCLDPYLMGYKNRDRYLDQNYYSYVFDLSGNATTTILHEGKVIGIWDFDAPLFKYFLFYDMESETIGNLFAQAEKIGRFISGKDIRLKEKKSMKPLAKRTGAGTASPLKDS